MASGGKKKSKTKGKTLNLTEFLASEDGTVPAPVPMTKSWAAEMENADIDDTDDARPVFDRSKLPTAPKAARGPDVNLASIPTKPPYTAFVGNLPYDASEDKITDFFQRQHNLEVVNVRLPNENGRQRGFGYVEFGSREALIDALTLNESMFSGRKLRVDLAEQSGGDGRENRGDRDDWRGSGGDPSRTEGDWRKRDAPPAFSDDRGPPSRGGFSDRGGDRYGDRGDRFGDRGGDRYSDRGDRYGDRERGGGFSDRSGGFSDRSERFGDRDRDRGFERRDRDRGFGDRYGDRDRGYGGDRDRGYGDRYGGRDDRDRGFDRGYGDRDRGFQDRERHGGDRDRYGDRDRGGFGDRDRGYGGDRDDRYGGGRRGFSDRRDGDRFGGRSDRDDDRGYGGRRSYGGGFRRDDDRRPPRDDRPASREGSQDAPRERPKLNLQPRSKPIEPAPAQPEARSTSIFGGAKPVDTAKVERYIEKKMEEMDVKLHYASEQPHDENKENSSGNRDAPRPRRDSGNRPRRDSDRSDSSRGRERRASGSSSKSGQSGPSHRDDVSRHSDDSHHEPPTSPKQEEVKMVPAPPPKENAWARPRPALTDTPKQQQQPANTPNRGSPSDHPDRDRRDSDHRDGERRGGYGRGYSKPEDRNDNRGSDRRDSKPKRAQREKQLPKSIEDMPKLDQGPAKDWADTNKFAFLGGSDDIDTGFEDEEES